MKKKSPFVQHALNEFRALKWIDENENIIEQKQEEVCKKVLEVFDLIGDNPNLVMEITHTLAHLAKNDNLTFITGEDWEWENIANEDSAFPIFQNKRCRDLFKCEILGEGAYYRPGIIFYDYIEKNDGTKEKINYIDDDSIKKVEFPFSPGPEYKYKKRVQKNNDVETSNVPENLEEKN